MKIVFHGSYIEVKKPDLTFSRANLDFGKGFYVTTDHEQATRWARRWLRRGHKAIVNSYIYSDELIEELNLKFKGFPFYDNEWLHFVADNRKGIANNDYDIICGGIANDKVFNTLELFFDGLIPESAALDRLKLEKPNSQICIRTQHLIESLLHFDSSEEVIYGGE